jgi:hypothetical protein
VFGHFIPQYFAYITTCLASPFAPLLPQHSYVDTMSQIKKNSNKFELGHISFATVGLCILQTLIRVAFRPMIVSFTNSKSLILWPMVANSANTETLHVQTCDDGKFCTYGTEFLTFGVVMILSQTLKPLTFLLEIIVSSMNIEKSHFRT